MKWQSRIVLTVFMLALAVSLAVAFGYFEIVHNWPLVMPEGWRDWLDWTYPWLLG